MKLLDRTNIQAIVLDNVSDSEVMLMMVSENLQRENLNVYDETSALLEIDIAVISLNKSTEEIKSFLFQNKKFLWWKNSKT